uniref:Uncharacterized protein n=1 Tax=Eutreptiella gymnastica TaxID=73025 RepID=A0A7S1IAS0_9EUGL
MSDSIVFELVPVKSQWNATIIRGYNLPGFVAEAAGFGQGCGYAWPTDIGISISSVLAEILKIPFSSGIGTVPSTIWTGQKNSSGAGWELCLTPTTCYWRQSLDGQWATGFPTLPYAAVSVTSNSLITQPASTETWVVVAYFKNTFSTVSFPSPSPGSIFVPSLALPTRYSLLLLTPMACLILGLVA